MPKKWTHTGAFAHFSTKPRNVQWSWSARNEDESTVVVTLWQDQFRNDDGKLIYVRPAFDPAQPDTRPGFRELMDNLTWAEANSASEFKVIMAVAKDVTAHPRSIARCFPSEIKMRLTELDVNTGYFRAEQVLSHQ